MSEINDTEELYEVTFPNNLKPIQKYQRSELSIIDKYINGEYHKGSFCGFSNTNFKPIMCKDNIVIPSKLQSYVVHWYHMYILHTVMDGMEDIICQHFY